MCVDTYSLYQGIAKKKSLYAKVIKQNGKLLSKIDKTPSYRDTYTSSYIVSSDGRKRPLTQDKKNHLNNRSERKANESGEALKQNYGITSHKHDDLDKWISKIPDDGILPKLEQYRNEFAHRLDSLENSKRELQNRQPQNIEEMLDTISEVLNSYFQCFQNLLSYTTSQHYMGIEGLRYDSLYRLKLADNLFRTEKSKNNQNSST